MELYNLNPSYNPRKVMKDIYTTIPEFPIRGGWGYTKEDAVFIDKNDTIINQQLPFFDGVSYEYTFLEYRNYLELITSRAEDDKYSLIRYKTLHQELVSDGDYKYDHITIEVTCLKDEDFEELKEEWENNSMKDDFDLEKHNKKHEAKTIRFEREGWFEISSFYGI